MPKKLLIVLKFLVLAAVVWFLGREVHKNWADITHDARHIDWRFAPVGVLGFCGVMLTSGGVWRWMARRMGDRSPSVPLLGAYTFSQMGKYIPGKVVLLLMRIERTGRFGMDPRVCTIATLLENAMYMLSGGLVASITLLFYARNQPLYLALIAACTLFLMGAFHPRVFYFLINKGLQKLKRPPIDPAHRLKTGELILSVFLFLPCWLFGGLAIWATCRCFTPGLSAAQWAPLPGAFAASVIGGMASILPGGLGVREAVLGVLVAPLVSPFGVAIALPVALQRLLQVTAEVLLGVLGAGLTARKPAATAVPENTR